MEDAGHWSIYMSNVCRTEIKFSQESQAVTIDSGPEPDFQRGFEPYSEKALKCQFSRKDFSNNSVFCNRLDQWVSLNNCEFACRKGVFP
jgi:hypothetical protein